MLEVHAILQRQRCNENITKKTGTLSDAYNYWIAIRPQTIPFDELYISECCLEDRFAILKSFKKINVPIKGIELLELVYNQDKSIHYDTAFKFVVDVLRKLLLFRLLTIDSGPRKALTE